jgi:outer membrane protein assembly factor BamB
MKMRMVVGTLVWLLAGMAAQAEDWPVWRGPRGDGTSTETGIPLRWSATENVAWKTPIPGKGYSSPIIWGNRVFVTSCTEEDGKRVLLCLDRECGKVLWQQIVLTAPLEKKHHLNSYASSTPVTDGRHVWVTFLAYPNMEVACFDLDGNKVWQRSPGKLLSVHGFCTSPILHQDLLILNGDQDAEAYLVALDKNSGQERWRVDRPNRTRSYCTPLLIQTPHRPGITQLVLSGSKCVASYDADTGKQLWIHDGPTEQYVASLVLHQGVLFLTTGFPERHLMGLSPDGEGNITSTRSVLWHIPHSVNGERGASYVPSPIAHDGYFFVVSDAGYLSCLEARTGKRLWMHKLGRRHSASPVLVQGHFVFLDDDGNCFVVKASPHFEIVARNVMGEECYASPAVAHGQLFVRTLHDLYCLGNGGKKSRTE